MTEKRKHCHNIVSISVGWIETSEECDDSDRLLVIVPPQSQMVLRREYLESTYT